MAKELSLDSIGLKYKTDKASQSHDYLRFYENFFAPLRAQELNILEFGVWNGASLRTWAEYFPKAKIVGADIEPLAKRFERDRVRIEILDQSNIEEVTRAAVKHGPFDIIIEDGSHMWEHQITTLRTAFPFLKSNGYYIVEDLQTNYGSLQEHYKGIASISCADYLKEWVDLHTGDTQIPLAEVEDAFLRTYGRSAEFITFYRRACVIKKRYINIVRAPIFGRPLAAQKSGASAVNIRVLAHLSHRGDVQGVAGYVNIDGDLHAFQGISLESALDVLEYRVRWPNQSWSDWSPTNTFVGTRGQARLLTGVTVRLRESAKGQYFLRTVGRFVGTPQLVDVSDGLDCASEAGSALCGLQVELAKLASPGAAPAGADRKAEAPAVAPPGPA